MNYETVLAAIVTLGFLVACSIKLALDGDPLPLMAFMCGVMATDALYDGGGGE